MENKKRFYLDPDFRKDPDTTKPYCCRCQKHIKDETKAIKVSVEWESDNKMVWECWQDEAGKYLLGPDCAKRIGMK